MRDSQGEQTTGSEVKEEVKEEQERRRDREGRSRGWMSKEAKGEDNRLRMIGDRKSVDS